MSRYPKRMLKFEYMIIGIRVRTIYERCKKMIKRNARFDTLEKRVEELFAWVNECST